MKFTIPIGKDRLLTTIFQGRAVKLRGCNPHDSYWDGGTFEDVTQQKVVNFWFARFMPFLGSSLKITPFRC